MGGWGRRTAKLSLLPYMWSSKALSEALFDPQIQSLNTDFIVPMEMKLKEGKKNVMVSFVHLSRSHKLMWLSFLFFFAERAQDLQNQCWEKGICKFIIPLNLFLMNLFGIIVNSKWRKRERWWESQWKRKPRHAAKQRSKCRYGYFPVRLQCNNWMMLPFSWRICWWSTPKWCESFVSKDCAKYILTLYLGLGFLGSHDILMVSM